IKTLEKNTPGAGWNGSKLRDAKGLESDNYFMLYQDTYVFGKGYLGITNDVVPAKYYNIK
ncbi:MAG: hypothetical protein KA336_04115, partial [Fusobacteriaceae bacterium]|nr:hypothetical protein [Fusobacteriaceae bacterium]